LLSPSLLVFRHSETFDNQRGVFSGWRDSNLTVKGFSQAKEIAKQLEQYKIDYAFTSHLKRARKTLEIALQKHSSAQTFIDDRLIERCYGLLQGKKKKDIEQENPDYYSQIHRGYNATPPQGESLIMVERRVTSFIEQLMVWLKQNAGNVAISCHSNSIRPIRRIFENLTVEQMLKLESSQDLVWIYCLPLQYSRVDRPRGRANKASWKGVVISRKARLATDTENLLKMHFR